MFKTIPRVYFKDYFKAIEEKKFECYPFNLKLKKLKNLKEGQSNGIYSIFFKNKLIYIGLHYGKGNVVTRWEKHIKSFTSRFLPLNFLSAHKTKIKKKNKFTKFYKNLTFNKLIDFYSKLKKRNDREYIKIEKIISDHIKLKKNELKSKYKKIYYKNHDIFKFLEKIEIYHRKKLIQLLTNEGSNTTINRLKFSLENWNEFKKKDSQNILDHFECVYFKYIGNKKLSKKTYKEQIEKRCIEEFKPFANSGISETHHNSNTSQFNEVSIKYYLNNELNI